MTGTGRPRPSHYEVEIQVAPQDRGGGTDAPAWAPVTVHRAVAGPTPLRFASLRTARDYVDRHAARGLRIVLVDEHGGREPAGRE